ncbi:MULTISPECIES: hypothetical protein [unclassified Leifsonia]|uniref:hypothetical protein n=1 Tax=unclassified Leifsonia TaxID=2663824 RepID=UPI000A19B11E|nr:MULTISPECIES: hypothetical protein [unclassified Leifsonia]QIZ99683.1 hypothetical protein HF024_14980 [Leifsonia sp. PS1209]
MTDLKLDLELLGQLKSDLEAIVSEFKGADDFSDAVADATGHDGLSGHVRDFAHKWNDKRKKMTESVESLSKSVAGVTDGFTKVDEGLATALEDAAKSQDYPAAPAKN